MENHSGTTRSNNKPRPPRGRARRKERASQKSFAIPKRIVRQEQLDRDHCSGLPCSRERGHSHGVMLELVTTWLVGAMLAWVPAQHDTDRMRYESIAKDLVSIAF